MQYPVVDYVTLYVAHDDRTRRLLAFDAQRQDSVSLQLLERVRQGQAVDLHGPRFQAMAVDVGGRIASATERLHFLAENGPVCDGKLNLFHVKLLLAAE